MIKKALSIVLSAAGYACWIAGTVMFLVFNDGIFFNTAVMALIAALCIIVLPACLVTVYFIKKKKKEDNSEIKKSFGKLPFILSAVFIAGALASLLGVVLNGLVVNYFQPITLSIATSVTLIVGAVLLIVGALVFLLDKKYFLSATAAALVIVSVTAGVIWASAQDYRDFADGTEVSFLFAEGEEGYASFRIPSIIVMEKEVLNEKFSYDLSSDVVIAFCEGRKDSAHDTGRIDLVGKISLDGGKTFGALQTFFTFGEEVGKVGNPTAVFDVFTGYLHMAFMRAAESEDYYYRTFTAKGKLTSDGTMEWGEIKDISLEKDESAAPGGADGVRTDTLMVGPGKGVQITEGEKAGRIIIPASNAGFSFVLYSDDGGESWHRGANAGEGNECEAALLSDGTLAMVIRDNTGCTMYHPEQYQRISYSDDGGETWYIETRETSLRTPICMSSLCTEEDGTLLLSYPDSFRNRVNLTLAKSDDGGKSWTTQQLYPGASGYSCAEYSDGKILIVAEIGKVNYSEGIVLLKLQA